MQYLYPLLTVMIWAGNNVITKAAAGRIFPAEIGFYRWLLAGLLFTPFLLGPVLRNRAKIRPIIGKVVVLGVLGMAIYQSLAYYAANITTATNMGIILSLVPVMTLGMSIASLGTRLTAGALVGAFVSFAGVLWVVSQGSWSLLVAHGTGVCDLQHAAEEMAIAHAALATALSADSGGDHCAVPAVPDFTENRFEREQHSVGALCVYSDFNARAVAVDESDFHPRAKPYHVVFQPGADLDGAGCRTRAGRAAGLVSLHRRCPDAGRSDPGRTLDHTAAQGRDPLNLPVG
jgi:hypothetical protein